MTVGFRMLLLGVPFKAYAQECISISVSTCLHHPQDLYSPASPDMLREDIFFSVIALW